MDRLPWLMVGRILRFLEYDEVTLFSLNYSCLIALILEPSLFIDLFILLFASPLLAAWPLTLVYTVSVFYGMYFSIKHVWTDAQKDSRTMLLMAGGAGILACSTAALALFSLVGSSYLAKIPAIYAFGYNFLIIWFMGLLPGMDVGKHFISKHNARFSEAIVALVVVTLLAVVLKYVYDFPWWRNINTCVFYSLSANKLVILGLEWNYRRTHPEEFAPRAHDPSEIASGESGD